MYGVGLMFAFKGIENFVARYLFIYATPLAIITNTLFISELIQKKRKLALLLLVMTLVVGTISMTESLYTPYASLLKTPDSGKFQQLLQNYYGPSMFGKVHAPSEPFFLQWKERGVQIIKLYGYTQNQHPIVYNNGFVIGLYRS